MRSFIRTRDRGTLHEEGSPEQRAHHRVIAMVSLMDIARKIIDLLSARKSTASICPSDVARALVDGEQEWRALMPAVREAAADLARSGFIVITQGNQQIDPNGAYRGPVRLRQGPAYR